MNFAGLFPNLRKCRPSVFHAEVDGVKYRFECRGDGDRLSLCGYECRVFKNGKRELTVRDIYLLGRLRERFFYEDILKQTINRYVPHIAEQMKSQILDAEAEKERKSWSDLFSFNNKAIQA